MGIRQLKEKGRRIRNAEDERTREKEKRSPYNPVLVDIFLLPDILLAAKPLIYPWLGTGLPSS